MIGARLSQQLFDTHRDQKSTADQPSIQNRPRHQRTRSGPANLRHPRFDSQRGHCHGERERVERIERVRGGIGQDVQRIHDNQRKETKREPGNGELALCTVSGAALPVHPHADHQQHRHE